MTEIKRIKENIGNDYMYVKILERDDDEQYFITTEFFATKKGDKKRQKIGFPPFKSFKEKKAVSKFCAIDFINN